MKGGSTMRHTAERREWQRDTLKELWVVPGMSSAWWVGGCGRRTRWEEQRP